MSDDKKVIVNGKEEAPIRKFKVPLDFDWQAVVKKKREASGGG